MSVIELYEKLSSAPNERERAKIIAEAFEALEERYPNLNDLATRQNLRETELRLVREIEQLRGELKETELRLVREIEQLRADTKTEIENLRGEFKTEIEQLRGDVKTEIENLRGETKTEMEQLRAELKLEIKAVEVRLTQAIHRQTLWVIGSIGAIIAFVRLLEWLAR